MFPFQNVYFVMIHLCQRLLLSRCKVKEPEFMFMRMLVCTYEMLVRTLTCILDWKWNGNCYASFT